MFLLKILPAPLHRALYRLAHWGRKQAWKAWHSNVIGVRVLALNDAGAVLLVRHSYGSRNWAPPGGGLGSGEDPVAAGLRELAEETSCVLDRAQLVAVVDEDLYGLNNRVHVVVGCARGPAVPDEREIVEAGFFRLDALPGNMRAGLAENIREWVQAYGGR
ncbi:NUDIX domain-containing protein [Novosphingobium album (ex Hu et al. 2023)]|uniref:NUDIX domain-containing protein n=1 Tax=Novosphingobium album (ex Hu et al. 2023) TaxID=2930093 RepID=A0ABT0B6T7_9SPHN|nr:NUDIX domain-containing protein [Novosphingobium album (ex Hu et al. 2023)]MCJ2180524.1 NUDIX domain-containing protein [Novosphingobium album (ex Hu et al. 2023)]